MKRFVLFDIDGTLIDPGGAGRRSVTQAFNTVFSISDAFASIAMDGKTDIQIIKEGLSAHRLPAGERVIFSIVSEYVKNLKKEIDKKTKHLMPGVYELLNALQETDGYWLGLLTGNIQQGARIKLGAFNLNGYFPVGAFGDDHEDRNMLLPVAVERLKKAEGITIEYPDCIVVGDTPLDVQCAKPFGATSIAVATGPHSYDELLQTEADYVLKDLSDAMKLFYSLSS
ncbi:MAG TPA: HAD family hydrolase [Desulfatiglandales bacterium]|nr:HAD family hydrolase [Desulfatiglandales bacterium]